MSYAMATVGLLGGLAVGFGVLVVFLLIGFLSLPWSTNRKDP